MVHSGGFQQQVVLFRITQGGAHNDYVISVQKQLYNGRTLATEIQTRITEVGYTPTVIYNASKQTISVSLESFNFQFLTNTELLLPRPAWNGANYDINNLNSANDLIKNTQDLSTIHNSVYPLITHIDLQPVRNIYIYLFTKYRSV